jgi:tripartite-type tricarboxylate transporter receptor subunit TctC
MQIFSRRQFVHMAAGAAAVPALSYSARAQSYPVRPVRLVVAAAAGGPTDIAKLDRLARNVAFVSSLMEAGVDFEAVRQGCRPTAERAAGLRPGAR